MDYKMVNGEVVPLSAEDIIQRGLDEINFAVDPTTVPIPAPVFWAAVEDLLGLTKYSIMDGIIASSALTEPEKMDALANISTRDNYRWEDGNLQKLLPLFGYPDNQAATLWAYMVDHYA